MIKYLRKYRYLVFAAFLLALLPIKLSDQHSVAGVNIVRAESVEQESDYGELDNGDEAGAIVPVNNDTVTESPPATQEVINSGLPAAAINTNSIATHEETVYVPVNKITPLPWPWIIVRAAGLTSFILLALLSVTGILLTTGVLYRIFSPATAWSFHRAIATVLLFSVVTHVGLLLFDKTINFRLADILVPLVSPYRPWLVAAGILGFYILLLVLISSLYTISNHAKFWRTVHALSFVMFTSIFIHGVVIGSDAKLWWVKMIYWLAGVAVGASVIYRLIWKYRSAPR